MRKDSYNIVIIKNMINVKKYYLLLNSPSNQTKTKILKSRENHPEQN